MPERSSGTDGETDSASGGRQRLLWGAAFLVLIALAVPWFLWRTDSVIAGLPVWLWWHVGWLVLTALVFRAFTERAWGLFVEEGAA